MIEAFIEFISCAWADYEAACIEWFNGGDQDTSARIMVAMEEMWAGA